MPHPLVVNIRRTDQFDVYIGRGSQYGNDWSHRSDTKARHVVETREKAVECYRVDLWRRLNGPNGPRLIAELAALKGKRLGCYCAPKLCHGEVLAAAAEWAAAQIEAGA